jgi:HD-GYP domain-containing protein (c-di-GMP phosphodiesterase class II)
MSRKLRRKIWTRLLFVSALLAAFAGGSVFLVERAEIARRVLLLALDEARSLAPYVENLSTASGRDGGESQREVAGHVLREHVSKGHFVVIEIYDLALNALIGVERTGFAQVREAAEARLHAFATDEKPDPAQFTLGGETYLQVFAPLQEGDRTLAYFEGIYRIDPDALGAMNRGLVTSVALVVLVILAAAATLYPVILSLNGDLLRLSGDLAHANMGMLAALGSAVAKRDRGTNAHNYRVTIYAIRLAEALGLSPDRIRGLIKGAFLHDVGKIAIADAVLKKPGRLDEEETAHMQAHVHHGVEIVGKFRWLADALDVVQHHHEKMDGSGYPAGLRGDEIPIAARIFAIVDVFDALTTRRPYKEPVPLHEAVFTLLAGKGRSFDPALLDVFLCLAPELHRTICGAGEPELVRTLDRLLGRYFDEEEGHVSRRQRRTGRRTRPLEESELEYLSGAWSLEPRPGSVLAVEGPREGRAAR